MDKGNISDGYHTFNELYYHRCILTAVIFNEHSNLCWKSKLHSDNTMFDGMFIVGMNTHYGQATYHYDLKYWDLFKIPELKNAPTFDGHTANEAIDRIRKHFIYEKGGLS